MVHHDGAVRRGVEVELDLLQRHSGRGAEPLRVLSPYSNVPPRCEAMRVTS